MLQTQGFTDDEPYKAITPDFGKPVLYLRAYVGIEYPSPLGFKAVLLEGYHSGTLNTSDKGLIRLCRKASEENIPVFLTGDPKGFEYETKQNYASLEIVSLPPAAPIAAYVRLMMLPEAAAARSKKLWAHIKIKAIPRTLNVRYCLFFILYYFVKSLIILSTASTVLSLSPNEVSLK